MRLTPREMKARIARYFAACNSGDAKAIADSLSPRAVHYFPGIEPVRGAQKIGALWAGLVNRKGSQWTIDRFLAGRDGAVIEWTHYQTKSGRLLRGAEWYSFDEDGRIAELKAYYAAPSGWANESVQLKGYPYKERGYHSKSPTLPKGSRTAKTPRAGPNDR
ncbi:MAG: nuclear transport factor 2 family protein [Thaumarchaeota archaeon]|nr:nuclear transport factor 2 family protein [Nitrososphaerota archaeon]